MGNTLRHNLWVRSLLGIALFASTSLSAYLVFPYAHALLSTYHIEYYDYEPQGAVESEVDTSQMAPAIAVPILMYHGVTDRRDRDNTTRANFIAQMEMLKRNGYETISLADFDAFRAGTTELPPRPIIITFDDGRKDSYYQTDDILMTLGFRATMFYASGPIARGNSFYLSWEEMRALRDSGRWEIESHAKYAHERVKTGLPGEWAEGTFLMSKIYNPRTKELETDEAYAKRVEGDYYANIEEIKRELDIDVRYFAIPLNDYGQHHLYNYEESASFNRAMLEKYFKLALIQVNSPEDVSNIHLPVYNFAHDDPYRIRRIEVKNMPPQELLSILERERPTVPDLSITGAEFAKARHIQSSPEGTRSFTDEGIVVTAGAVNDNGKIAYGQPHWDDYEVTATMRLDAGRSAVLVFYYQGSGDLMAFGRTDNGFFLRSTVDGVTKDEQRPVYLNDIAEGFAAFTVRAHNGRITAMYNDRVVFQNVAVPLSYGGVGIKVWGEQELGQATLRSLTVSPL